MIWWKIYFWLSVIASVFAVIGFAIEYKQNNLFDLITFIMFFLSLLGLYSFIYNKKFFLKKFWFYFFWINLIIDIIYTSYYLAPNDPIISNLSFINGRYPVSGIAAIIVFILDIPVIYALYKLGISNNKPEK